MKYSRLHIPLVVLFFSTFCHGQVTTGFPLSMADGNPKLIKTQGSSEYDNVHCALQDKAGNIWFGTTGEGIYRYDGKSFINFTKKHGLASNEIWCVYEDRDNNIWFGTGDGVCRYSFTDPNDPGSGTFLTFRITDGLEPVVDPLAVIPSSEKNAVWSILQDKAGILWFGTSNGVYCYDGKSTSNIVHNTTIVNANNLQLKHIQSILEDRNGNIWFASWNQEGACRFNGKTLTHFKPNGDGMVHALLEDKKGNIWFGTRNNGVCYYNGKTFKSLVDTGSFSRQCVYSIDEDTAGNIWFATEPSGVWCYKTKASQTSKDIFINYTIKDGLSHNSVFSVLVDRSGKLWFGTRATQLCNYDGKTFRRFSE